jgi:hypothetical protein
MKNILFLLLFILSFSPVYAGKYDLFTPHNYRFDSDAGEQLLFILDLSNSMNEPLENDTKFNLMLKTMYEILPKISPDTQVGLRVYGYKMGFTPIEACRASVLASPIASNNSQNIQNALSREHTLGFIEGRESLNED